jgi:DNA-binding NtrC family response regulator
MDQFSPPRNEEVIPLRILIIAEDKDMLDLLEDEIREIGHRVTRATGEASAVKEASRGQFDLVIADVVISGAMEPEFLENLRTFQPDASIVVITSFGIELTFREAFRKGADYYLAKPIQMETLKDFISHIGRERMKVLEGKDPSGRRIMGQGEISIDGCLYDEKSD